MRVLLEIRNVGGKGLGVFSRTNLPKATKIIRYRGRPRWIWEIPRWQWDHLFQIGYDLYLVPTVGSYGWSINHSCSPNCAVKGERDIVTAREVASGEELTFDYSTNVGWDGYQLICSCGSPECRGTVTCYQRLDDRWKGRYGGTISPFLLTPPRKARPTLF